MPKAAAPATAKEPWKLKFFITEAGACDVMDFFDELREADFTSYSFFIDNLLTPMEQNGPHSLPGSYWEDLGDGFSDFSWGRHRVYCCIEPPPRTVWALVAVMEKRFRTFQSRRRKYRNLAAKRRAEIRSGRYNEAQRNAAYQLHRERRGKQ